jgi:hypothetical protein
MGASGLLVGGFRDWPVVSLEVTFVVTGACLLWKMRSGVVLLAYLGCSVLYHIIFDGGHPLVSIVELIFFAAPCWFYYPRQWKELSWTGAPNRKIKHEELAKPAGLQPEQIKHEIPAEPNTFLPDLGKHLASKGTPQKTALIYPAWETDTIAVAGLGKYCVTMAQPFEGKLYCATFDFGMDILEDILERATQATQSLVLSALVEDPYSIRRIKLPNPVNIGVMAMLGDVQQGIHEMFIPLVVLEVFGGDPSEIMERISGKR